MFKFRPRHGQSPESAWPILCNSALHTMGNMCLLLALMVSVRTAWADPITFTDNFSPPSPLWSNLRGSWTATGGQYFAQVPNNNPPAFTLLPFDLTGDTLTVTANGVGDSGILVRSDATASQFVILILGGLNYGQGQHFGTAGNSIYWSDSNSPAPQGLVTGVFTPGGTYTITVTAVGNTFSAYINGSATPVTTVTDSVAGSHGRVGLYDDQPNTTTGSGFGTPSSFSNFSLQGTTTASTVPEPASFAMLGSVVVGLSLMRLWRRTALRRS
jgi:hypothetical protein